MDKGAAKTELCKPLENLSGLVPFEVRRLGNITADLWWSSHCFHYSGVVDKNSWRVITCLFVKTTSMTLLTSKKGYQGINAETSRLGGKCITRSRPMLCSEKHEFEFYLSIPLNEVDLNWSLYHAAALNSMTKRVMYNVLPKQGC